MLIIGFFVYIKVFYNTDDNEVTDVTEHEKYYPLTHPQLGIWYTEKMYPGTSIGNIAATLRIKNVCLELLEKAINLCIENNDSFRLHFKEISGEPVQYVVDYKYQGIEYIDFSEKGLDSMYEWDLKQSQAPFALSDSDLYKFAILKIDSNTFGIYSKLHHLICDGWSMVRTGNIIMEFYNDLVKGVTNFEDKKTSYIDYVEREREYFSSNRFSKDELFWNSRFEDFSFNSGMLYRNKLGKTSYFAKRKTFVVQGKLVSKISEYVKANNTTVFSLFLSALVTYLYRVTGDSEHIVGVPVLNRTNAMEKRTCGMFVNKIPFNTKIDENLSFKSLVSMISHDWMSLLRHQRYPYELIKSNTKTAKSSNSIFSVLLSYQNAKFTKDDLEHEGRWHFSRRQLDPLYIHINEREDNGELVIDYDYLTDIFFSKEIDYIHEHIIRLLWHGLDDPNKPISKLEIVSEKEKQKVVFGFNETKAQYPQNATIQQLFREKAKAYPNSIAVVESDKDITYEALDKKSDYLAKTLRDKGVKANTIVALLIDRSIEMIVAILGILKAGGTYLPIDPSHPQSRITLAIKDSSPLILLTSEDLLDRSLELADTTGMKADRVFAVEPLFKNKGITDFVEIVTDINKPSDIAYIIYTSGSTGIPKGVMVKHKNVVRLLFNDKAMFDFSSDDVWTMFHSYCFDFSVWEMYGALLYGGKLVMVPRAVAQDSNEFLRLLIKNKVTILNQVPTSFYNLSCIEAKRSERDLGIRYVIFGGEALKPLKLKKWRARYPNTRLINMYGITETTVHSTYKEITAEMINMNTCNIGVPIPTTSIYILDKFMQLVPIGVKGEIHVGGYGVAKGYLNRPDLTKDRFVENPFIPGDILYKSGDAGRWYPEGEIEYLGRLDYQVKIHGYRVELGEIESKISQYKQINDAVVLSTENENGDGILSAYFTADEPIEHTRLKEYLALSLPHYMVPGKYIQLEEMPINKNGKADRRALKVIKQEIGVKGNFAPPRNETEAKLALIWREVLDVESIGINDDFFDLGGDSIKIIQVQVKSYNNNWGIKTQDLYLYPTIKQLYDNVIHQQEKINHLSNNYYNHNVPSILKPKEHEDFNNVLLTGATGFLGIHLLHQLLTKTDAIVFCLIRRDGLDSVFDYYFEGMNEELQKRVRIVRGDITKNLLGLSEAQYSSLSRKIDIIIHSAANVKHYGSFDDFNKTNVLGTKELLKLCKLCNAVFHHISTVSISGSSIFGKETELSTFSESDFFIGQNIFSNVYLHTKLEAEKLVLDEAAKGMKVNIYRMGNITGRYSDGVAQKNINENAFCRRIRSIILLGAISEHMAELEMEMTPVDVCSETVINILKRGKINSIYHLYNKKFKARDFVKILRKLNITDIEILNEMEYRNRLNTISEDTKMQQSLDGIINEISSSKGFEYDESIITSNKLTFELLESINTKWPETLDENYISKLMDNMVKIGFMEGIGQYEENSRHY